MIIGLSGHIGSGKNYVAENVFLPILFDMYKDNKKTKDIHLIPYFFSFGDHMKVECLCRIPYEQLSCDDGYNNYFVNKDQVTREKLQKYGTENGRNIYHPDMWVRAVEIWIDIQTNRLKKLSDLSGVQHIPVFIISDVRFINEANFIKKNNGLLIRVDAENRSNVRVLQEANGNQELFNNIKHHISETELDNYDFQYRIDNSTENHEYVESQIKNFVISFYLK
jgi:hypothetical protein